ncbi:MAG: DUF4241 domain-containing protein [Pseudomonadota bacterium]
MSLWDILTGRSRTADTGMTVKDWIVDHTDADLAIADIGAFDTPEGKCAMIDPLVFAQPPDWISIPTEGAQLVAFRDVVDGRNSKLALIFPGGTVAGGAEAGVCLVDAGMASVFTPATHAAMDRFIDALPEGANPYDDYFSTYDDPAGGEHKIVALPDGTPVPYIHSGWGDGAYPVFTLTDVAGVVIAVYTDFMGTNDDGDWLLPPGVTLD